MFFVCYCSRRKYQWCPKNAKSLWCYQIFIVLKLQLQYYTLVKKSFIIFFASSLRAKMSNNFCYHDSWKSDNYINGDQYRKKTLNQCIKSDTKNEAMRLRAINKREAIEKVQYGITILKIYTNWLRTFQKINIFWWRKI